MEIIITLSEITLELEDQKRAIHQRLLIWIDVEICRILQLSKNRLLFCKKAVCVCAFINKWE